MRLDQALADYGLRPQPVSLDVRYVMELPDDQRRLLDMVVRGFGLLHARWLTGGAPETVQGPSGRSVFITYNRLPPDCSCEFSWEHTATVIVENAWTCGLIEAMFRRWATTHAQTLRGRERRPIPLSLAFWQGREL